MVNLFVVLSALAFFISVIISLFVFVTSYYNPKRNIFIVIALLAGTWCLFPAIAAIFDNIWLIRLVYVSAIFTGPAFLAFGLSVADVDDGKFEKKLVKASYAVAVIFIPILFSDLMIMGFKGFQPHFSLIVGPAYPVFILFFAATCLYSFYRILLAFFVSSGQKRNQIKYIFLAYFMAFMSAVIHFGAAYGWREVFPHDILVLACMFLLAYAIFKYRLMDIKAAITRTAIFLIVYSLVMWLPFWIGYQTNSWVLSALFMAIFATGGPIIHRLLQQKAENVLMAQQKRYQRALIDAGRGMVREHDIKKLMKLIVRVVRFSVRVDFVCAFILDKHHHCYKIAALRGNIKFPEQFTMSDEHEIVAMINRHKTILTYEEINSNKNKPLGKEIHLVVPAFSGEKLLGFIIMGEKENRSVYSQEDVDVFSILSHQASLAIENCMFVEDTKESERRLFQAEKLASIGGMADGVAHQIKNRLNHFSIASGEAQYEIKDFIKSHSDLVEQNPDLKKTFDYLVKITESLVGNVKRTNSIIQGILNYARVEEKDTFFSIFTISEIMALSLDLLRVKHEVATLPITYEVDGEDAIYGVKAQVMEAVYNILDNCYESVNERYKYHTPEGDRYQMKINLTLRQGATSTIIEVVDNGMGIKDEDKQKIFAPFFTTKSSYKSGSGIGMYVVKRMVEENHRGKIYFESTYMQGARFVVELPKKM